MDKQGKLTLDKLVEINQALTAELQVLSMAQAVHDSAYVLLARHLATQGLVQPLLLAGDLKLMGRSQPDAGWQAGHEGLAAALLLSHGLAAGNGSNGAPRGL